MRYLIEFDLPLESEKLQEFTNGRRNNHIIESLINKLDSLESENIKSLTIKEIHGLISLFSDEFDSIE